MLSCDTVLNSNCSLLFKEFSSVDVLFRQHGWRCFINETGRVAYTRDSFETEYFEIKKNNNKYNNNKYDVSFPLINSNYQYKTTCSDAVYTKNYISDKFMYYIMSN
jgi:hypothetical protein